MIQLPAIVALLQLATAPAAGAPVSTAHEEQIEVRAAAPDEEDITAFGARIDLDDGASSAADLQRLLRSLPGVAVTSYGGLGRFATASIRGSTADQVLVLVDGVPRNRALGGAVDLSWLPVTQIESVTVFRGTAPAITGLTGLGGVIDIRTRRGAGRGARVDLLSGSLGTSRLSASVANSRLVFGAELFDSRGGFDYLSDNGTQATTADDSWRRRENDRVQSLHLLADGDAGGVAGGRARWGIRLASRLRGLPGTDALRARQASLRERRLDLDLRWSNQSSTAAPHYEALLDASLGRDRLIDRSGELGFGARDQLTRSAAAGLTFIARGPAGPHSLLGRLELREERARVERRLLSRDPRAGLERHRLAAVGEDRIVLGRRALLAPALRFERRWDAALGGGASPSDTWSARVALAIDAGGGWGIRAAAGSLVHLPGLEQLFGDQGAVLGNPDLRPERADKLDIGLRFAHGPIDAEATFFASESEDMIVFLPISFGQVRAQNLARARNRGAELRAALRATRSLSFEASVSVQHLRDASGGVADGHRVPSRPDAQGFLAARFRRGKLSAEYRLIAVGRVAADLLDRPELRLPARWDHGLRLGWEGARGLAGHLEIQNLTDQRVRDVARFPLPGRTIYFHLGWSRQPRRAGR